MFEIATKASARLMFSLGQADQGFSGSDDCTPVAMTVIPIAIRIEAKSM
jgi:hypothetical protein